jgi:hypothetical protein
VKLKYVFIIILVVSAAGVLEYKAMSNRTEEYRANYRGITCWGKEMVIKRTACCHSQCDKATEWPTKDTPPASCKTLWRAALN